MGSAYNSPIPLWETRRDGASWLESESLVQELLKKSHKSR